MTLELHFKISNGLVNLNFESTSRTNSQIIGHISKSNTASIAESKDIASLSSYPLKFTNHLCTFDIAFHKPLNFSLVVEDKKAKLSYTNHCQDIMFSKN